MEPFEFGPPAAASVCTETRTTHSRVQSMFLAGLPAADSGDELAVGGGMPFPGSDRDMIRVARKKRRLHASSARVTSAGENQSGEGECMDRVVPKTRVPLPAHWKAEDIDGYSSCEDALKRSAPSSSEPTIAPLSATSDNAPSPLSQLDDSFDGWARDTVESAAPSKSIEQQREEMYRGRWKMWTQGMEQVSATNCYFCMYASQRENELRLGIAEFTDSLFQRHKEPLAAIAKKVHYAMIEAHKKNPMIPPILTRHILYHLVKHSPDANVALVCMIKEVQTLQDCIRDHLLVTSGEGPPEFDPVMVTAYLNSVKTLLSLHSGGLKKPRTSSDITSSLQT